MGRRSQAGFTLLEAVVALAVVSVALYLAAGLLREAQVLSAAAGRQLTDPLAGVVAARLRADVQGADAVAPPAPGGVWTSGPLCLAERRHQGLLCWTAAGSELHRSFLGEAGGTSDATWLRSLVAWRWRLPAAGLVDLEVAYLRSAEPWRWRMSGPPSPPAPSLATERLRLALRGGGRGSGW